MAYEAKESAPVDIKEIRAACAQMEEKRKRIETLFVQLEESMQKGVAGFRCARTQEKMRDPVAIADGSSHERKPEDPPGIPNYSLKSAIESYVLPDLQTLLAVKKEIVEAGTASAQEMRSLLASANKQVLLLEKYDVSIRIAAQEKSAEQVAVLHKASPAEEEEEEEEEEILSMLICFQDFQKTLAVLEEIEGCTCLIQNTIMEDPVMVEVGHSYERSVIAEWLKESYRNPYTNLPMVTKTLIPNHHLRNAIQWHHAFQKNVLEIESLIQEVWGAQKHILGALLEMIASQAQQLVICEQLQKEPRYNNAALCTALERKNVAEIKKHLKNGVNPLVSEAIFLLLKELKKQTFSQQDIDAVRKNLHILFALLQEQKNIPISRKKWDPHWNYATFERFYSPRKMVPSPKGFFGTHVEAVPITTSREAHFWAKALARTLRIAQDEKKQALQALPLPPVEKEKIEKLFSQLAGIEDELARLPRHPQTGLLVWSDENLFNEKRHAFQKSWVCNEIKNYVEKYGVRILFLAQSHAASEKIYPDIEKLYDFFYSNTYPLILESDLSEEEEASFPLLCLSPVAAQEAAAVEEKEEVDEKESEYIEAIYARYAKNRVVGNFSIEPYNAFLNTYFGEEVRAGIVVRSSVHIEMQYMLPARLYNLVMQYIKGAGESYPMVLEDAQDDSEEYPFKKLSIALEYAGLLHGFLMHALPEETKRYKTELAFFSLNRRAAYISTQAEILPVAMLAFEKLFREGKKSTAAYIDMLRDKKMEVLSDKSAVSIFEAGYKSAVFAEYFLMHQEYTVEELEKKHIPAHQLLLRPSHINYAVEYLKRALESFAQHRRFFSPREKQALHNQLSKALQVASTVLSAVYKDAHIPARSAAFCSCSLEEEKNIKKAISLLLKKLDKIVGEGNVLLSEHSVEAAAAPAY